MKPSESHYKILKALEENPDVSQRELAEQLGVSLGKVNYCIRAVIDKGWVKMGNFSKSENKKAYMYYLTPRGVEEKAQLTLRFLKRKQEEYELLKLEIAMLGKEVQEQKIRNQCGGE